MQYLIVVALFFSFSAFATEYGLLVEQGEIRSPAPIVKTEVRINVTGIIARVAIRSMRFRAEGRCAGSFALLR
jgi:hypothetical protein